MLIHDIRKIYNTCYKILSINLGVLHSWAFVLFSIGLLNPTSTTYYQLKPCLIVNYSFGNQVCLTLS
jgi:hypothetical protein